MASLHPAIAAPLADAETQRLRLHRLDGDDLDDLAAIFADADVWRFETREEPSTFLTRQLKLWTDYGFGGCGVRTVDRPDLIGIVGLAVPTALQSRLPPVTVGWRFSPAVWGNGYATEAAAALLDQAFTTMALDRVGCVTNAENRRSLALAHRLGMRLITEATVPRDDGKGHVRVALLEIAHDQFTSNAIR
jgi:RimJ/RimL family protein N-acetyltransferase